MKASRTILLLAGIISFSSGLPNQFQCSRYCKEEKNSFGYIPGGIYTYAYSGTVTSFVDSRRNGILRDESGVTIRCSVEIHAISTCEYAMQIKQVDLEEYHTEKSKTEIRTESEKFQEFRELLTARPLHFSYHSGKIDTICPDGSEPSQILDVKKGILSAFQNSMQDLTKNAIVYETDVTGTCETSYETEIDADTEMTVIRKTKNLDACTHRMFQYLSWQSVPYATNNQARSLPLLRSTFDCKQIYNDQAILASSECDEKHTFQPFSNGDHGAATVVKQTLSLKTIGSGLRHNLATPKDVKRTTLAYETAQKDKVDLAPEYTIELFKDLETKTFDGVEADVPKLFSQLVYEFQNLNEKELLMIYVKLNIKQRKFFIDALSLITTTSGIEVMKQLHKENKISNKLMDSWIISLSFIKNPSLETIRAIQPLLTMNTTKQNTVLAISSIIYRYCQNNPSCLEVVPIVEILEKIENPLTNGCKASSQEKSDDILLSLKGIGNAGTTTSLHLLRDCYSNEDSPLTVRLAAIAAHRRMSCVRNFNLDDFKKYFANTKENTEIRIASYLATMQCASYAVFAQVKDVLMQEETNQVGSFVWTHITNLQETSVQWKQGVRKLLENEFLRNKFNTDLRKYSRNYEASAFFESIGAGGSLESNVIFTSESYLPRSAMLNFTLDLFGETINVFEVGARLEGFEEIVENIFGPEGYFSDQSIKSFLENSREAADDSEKVKVLGDVYKSKRISSKDPAGLVYAKVFGNELLYSNFKDLKELTGASDMDRFIDVFIDMFRQNDVEYQKSFMFLDSAYQIPTVVGFPLELVANGTATLGLTVKGKLDVKELWSYKMSVEGKVSPSASLEVVGTMTVNSFAAKTGVKFVGSLNSNTYIDGHVLIDAGKIIDVKVNVPKQQMDIISVNSDIFIVHNDVSYPIDDSSTNIERIESCTNTLVSKITGLEVCYNMRYVNASQEPATPYFPLTGSFKYAMNIKKTDTFDSYQLHIKTAVEEQSFKPLYLMSLYLDTPNSQVNRKIEASYHIDMEKYALQAKFRSPFTSFEINSSVGNELNKYSFNLETIYNNKEIVSLKTFLNRKDDSEKLQYDSQTKLNYQERQIAAITGSLKYMHRGQYSANLQLEGVTDEPITITGDLLQGPNSINLRTVLASRGFNGKMSTVISAQTNEVMFLSNLDYTLGSPKEEKLSLLAKLDKVRQGSSNEDRFKFVFESTHRPLYNFRLDLNNERRPLYYRSYANVSFFETTWEVKQLAKFIKEKQDTDIEMHAMLSCKEKGIDYKAVVAYNVLKSSVKTLGLLQLNQEERVEVSFSYGEADDSVTVDGLFYYPKQGWSFDGLLTNLDGENYNLLFNAHNSLAGVKRHIIQVAGDYKNSSVESMHDHKINCTIGLPESNGRWATPWIVTGFLQKSNDIFISYTQVKTKESIYATHMNWMKDVFNFVVQENNKRLMVANALRNKQQISVLFAINVYQHFELSSKLSIPFEKFDIIFYWDKDRDKTQKLSFELEQNKYKGLFNVDIEYPNQKIATAFVLLPTQVTLNVTWGIKVSQRIYLNVGNKVYDYGSVWFGELETPFQYLEKQQFNLKYIILPKMFEILCDVSWRYQKINLQMAGSKSTEHLSGDFSLNTTLPEIRRIGAAMSHRHQLDNNYKTDATFLYNDHQVTAQSNWKLDGVQIISDFRVESPTNTIDPIGGVLNVNTLQRNSVVLEFTWQQKIIKVVCKFKSDTSTIVVTTPFEGFETTKFDYVVKAFADSVNLAVTVDLFKQFNNVDLRWSNLDDSMEFWMNLTSPVTGYYSVHFTHSTVLGILKECFRVKGHQHKDLVLVKMDGKISSILSMHIKTFLQLLEHKASLIVDNKDDTQVISKVTGAWNNFTLASSLSMMEFYGSTMGQFNWIINSNVLKDKLEVLYSNDGEKCEVFLQIQDNYKIKNVFLKHLNYNSVKNTFWLHTNDMHTEAKYEHEIEDKLITQKFSSNFSGEILDYALTCKLEEPNVLITVDMPQKSHVVLTLNSEDGNYDLALHMNRTGEDLLSLDIKTDFSQPAKTITVQNRRGNSKFEAQGVFELGENVGSVIVQTTTVGSYFGKHLESNANVNYQFTDAKKEISGVFGNKRVNYKFDGVLSTLYNIHLKVGLKKNNANQGALEVLLNRNNGHAVLTHLHHKTKLVYALHGNKDFNLYAALASTYHSVPNSRVNATYSYIDGTRFGGLQGAVGERVFNSNVTFNLLKLQNNGSVKEAKLNTKFNLLYVYYGKPQIDFVVDFKSALEGNKSGGKLLAAVTTNVMKYKLLELRTEFADNKGYEGWAAFKRNDDVYKAEFNNFISPDIFEVYTKLEAPNIGSLKIEVNTIKKYNEYTTQMIVNINDQIYTSDFITSYVSLLNTATRFQITLPDNRYLGNIEVKLDDEDTWKLLNLTLALPQDNFNRFGLLWDQKSKKINCNLQIDYIELTAWKVDIDYDIDSDTKTVNVQYKDDEENQYSLRGEMHKNKLNVFVDKQDVKNYFVVDCNQVNWNSYKDFGLSCGLFREGKIFKVEALNYFGEYHETRLDIVSFLPGWRRFTVESKLDAYKIRMGFNYKHFRLSMFAKKYSPLGGDILSINYQGETLLEVSSIVDQLTIKTSSRFGQYRLYIVAQNPGIYGFSILRHGENLVSIMLQNFTTNKKIEFKGKVIAPELLPNFSNLSMHFNSHYDISKACHFHIHNSHVKLFEVEWGIDQKPSEYKGYFKFNSGLKMLQNLELYSDLNSADDIVYNMRMLLTQQDVSEQYTGFILIPVANSETKLNFAYPCKQFGSCQLHFNVKPVYLNFHWTSPFEEWGNFSVLSNFEYADKLLNFELGLRKLDTNCLGHIFLSNGAEIVKAHVGAQLDIADHKSLNDIEVIYDYYDLLEIIFKDERGVHKINGVFTKDLPKKFIKLDSNYATGELSWGGEDIDETKVRLQVLEYYAYFRKGLIGGMKQTGSAVLKTNYYPKMNIEMYYDLMNIDNNKVGFTASISTHRDLLYEITTNVNFVRTLTTGGIVINATNNLENQMKHDIIKMRWSSNLSFPKTLLEVNVTHNAHPASLKLLNEMEDKSINSLLIISCADRKMELLINGRADPGQLFSSFVLRTPLGSMSEIKMETALKHTPGDYCISNDLSWPDNRIAVEATAEMRRTHGNLHIGFESSFTPVLNSSVEYRRADDEMKLRFNTSMGDEFLRLDSEVVRGRRVAAELTSSFDGYRVVYVKGSLVGKNVTVVGGKDGTTVEMTGVVTDSGSGYEVDLGLMYPTGEEDTAKAYVRMLDNSFTGKLRFNNAVRMDVGLDNNIYNVYVASPYEYAKEIKLNGVYTNDLDVYNFKTNGNWNDQIIDVSGSINLVTPYLKLDLTETTNKKYRGTLYFAATSDKIEFDGSFPNEDSKAVLRITTNPTDFSISVATPFAQFNSLSINGTLKKYSHYQVYVTGDIFKKSFKAHTFGKLSDDKINGELFVHIPQNDNKLNISLAADPQQGILKINRLLDSQLEEISLSYLRETGRLRSSFDMTSSRYNVSHAITLIHVGSPGLEYGVIVDNAKLILKLSENWFKIDGHLPYFGLNNGELMIMKGNQSSFKGVFNKYLIRGDINFKVKTIETEFQYDIDGSGEGIMNINIERLEHGFEVVCPQLHATINYQNLPNHVQLNIKNLFSTSTDVHLDKSLNRVTVNITHNLYFNMERGEINKLMISNGNNRQFLDVQISEHSLLIHIRHYCIALEDANIVLNKITDSNSKIIQLYYGEWGVQKYNSSITYRNVDNHTYTLNALIIKDLNLKIVDLETKLTNKDSIQGTATLKTIEAEHTSNFTLNFKQPYVAKFYLCTPAIKNNQLSVEFEATSLKAITFYVVIGQQNDNNFILYQSAFEPKSISINAKAPNFPFLRLFELVVEWSFGTNNTSSNLLRIDSDVFGDVLIDVDFLLLDDLLDAETHLRVPFLKGFESFDGKIRIPTDFKPKIKVVLLNNVLFEVHFDHRFDNEVLFLDSGFDCLGYKQQAAFYVSLTNYTAVAEFEVKNQGEGTYVSLALRQHYYMFGIDGREYKLSYYYENISTRKFLHVSVSQPYSKNDYSIHLEYKNDKEHLIWLALPNLHTELKLGLIYENPLSFELSYTVKLPFTFQTYDFVDIVIKNSLNPRKTDDYHSLVCFANTNHHNVTFKLGAADGVGFKQFLLYTTLNDETLVLHLQQIGSTLTDFKSFIEIQTPLSILKNFKFDLVSNTNFANLQHSNELLLTYNDVNVIDGYCEVKKDKLIIIAENIWQPFLVRYIYARNYELSLLGEVIYDLRKPNSTRFGGAIFLGDKMSTALYLLDNVVSFNATSMKEESNEEYHYIVTINDNAYALYYAQKNESTSDYIYEDTKGYIQLPFRTFQIHQTANISTSGQPEVDFSVDLLWGDAETSSLSFRNEILPGKVTSKIITPALEHEIVLKIDMSKFNMIPSTIKAELVYSNDTEKRLQMEIFYNKDTKGLFATERNFIIKHPASKIDYELFFNSLRKHDFSNGSIVLKYKNFETDTSEAIKTSVKVDHDKFGVMAEVDTNKNNFYFKAASTSSDDTLGFYIDSKINEKDPLHLECSYNFLQVSPAVSFVASYGESRKYFLYAGLPSEREVTAKLGHELYGKYSLDSLLTMQLNTSQLLWVKIIWKKELYPQINKAVFEEYNDLRFVIEAAGKELIDVINDDIGKEFIKDVIDIKQNIIDYSNNEKDSIIQDFKNSQVTCVNSTNYFCTIISLPAIQQFGGQILQPFNQYFTLVQNTFEEAFTSLLNSIQHTFQVINEQIETALKDIKNIRNIKFDAKEILQKGISDARKSLKEMEAVTIKLVDDFDKYVGFVKTKVMEFFAPFLDLLDDLVAYVEHRLTLLQMAVLNVMETVQKYVYNLREAKDMLRVYASYINWLEELHLMDMLEPIGDIIEDVLETIVNDIRKITDHYKPYLDALSEAIFGKYDGLNQLPPITVFRDIVNRVYQRTIWIWNYHNMTEHLKDFIHLLSNDIDDVLSFLEFNEKSEDFDSLAGSYDYVIRPEIGLIEISQPLSFQWDAFNKRPSFEEHPLYKKIQKSSEQFMNICKRRYDLIDNLDDFFYDLTEPTITPVTFNYAMIIGKSHFITFNNHYYNFIGNCSYVLASDFKTNSFSLVVNYEKIKNDFEKSLDIMTAGVKVTITHDYKVLMNNRISDLPLLYSHLSVTREHETILIESTKGLKMICNTAYDFCSIQLSGWLFGRTAGLLGTMDNEKATDTTLVNGTYTKDVEEFTNSWKLQDKCTRIMPQEIQATPLVDESIRKLCDTFFMHYDSPLANCFNKVDVEPYYEICVQETKRMTKATFCSSTAAYKARCRRMNVHVNMPACVRCENSIGETEAIFDGHNPKAVDVVFINQLDCYQGNQTISLPNKLEERLNKAGYNNNLYASVGFGGKTLTKPHVYTSNNQIWTTSTDVKIVFKYDFARWNALKFKAVDAIKYAANLNFRPGVPKHFIILQCDSATEMENAPQMYNMLGEKDITLHQLKSQPFGNISNSVVGLTKTTLESTGAVNLSTDEVINEIEDVYSALALTTDGTIFDYDGILDNEVKATKWATLVAGTVKKSPCQKCKCVADTDGVGRTECSRCLTPAVKQFLNEYETSSRMKFGDTE